MSLSLENAQFVPFRASSVTLFHSRFPFTSELSKLRFVHISGKNRRQFQNFSHGDQTRLLALLNYSVTVRQRFSSYFFFL